MLVGKKMDNFWIYRILSQSLFVKIFFLFFLQEYWFRKSQRFFDEEKKLFEHFRVFKKKSLSKF